MADRAGPEATTPERHAPPHLAAELARLERQIKEGDPLWPPQLAIAVAIGLSFTLSDKLVVGPKWLIPSLEGVLLLSLVLIGPRRVGQITSEAHRRFLWVIAGVVTLTYLLALGLLVRYLITGGKTSGFPLIGSGAALWATNVLLFAVIYFELDGGGPLKRFEGHPWRDLLFPQMDSPRDTPLHERWRPTFLDYLYTALTNATAFSPTDTLPITQTAKVLMGIQGTAAVVTVGIVVARAVNILA